MAIFSSDIVTSAISASIADTAVDVFVYDTSKDSDGGAWRKKTKETSWYNETLNTATRGSRKEFPSVAVIVAETTKVTIYDGDDPDLPMWMVFNVSNTTWFKLHSSGPQCSCITALNATLCAGGAGAGIRLAVVDFIKDNQYLTESGYTYYNNGISTRNDTTSFPSDGGSKSIVNNAVNDVAMTVLPNALVDDTTGLPIPTIAIATDGGVSVIKDDGSVVDNTRGVNETYSIAFDIDNSLIFSWGTSNNFPRHITRLITSVWEVASSNTSLWPNNYFSGYNEGLGNAAGSTGTAAGGVVTVANSGRHFGIEYGTGGNTDNRLGILHPRNLTNYADQNLSAFITSSYNTGWMHGDIKGAFLSDTTAESLTANTNLAPSAIANGTNRLSSETYENGDTSWSMVDASGTANGYVKIEFTNLVVGQTYVISMTWDGNATLDGGYSHKIQHQDGTGSENFTEFFHWNKTNGSSETLTGIFTAQTTDNENLLIYANAITLNISNFIVSAVDDEDRSVNNKGLQVFGTVTKSAVATGAELVAYNNGGSNTNYLEQPYNSDLDFGTNDFSVCVWFRMPDCSTTGFILDRADSSGNERIAVYTELDAIRLYTYDGSASEISTSLASSYDNQWIHYVVNRHSSGLMEAFINGVKTTTTSPVVRNVTNTDAHMVVSGRYAYNLGNQHLGDITLLRISGSAPSSEQIKKMYEDEKHLFQENAKATLYGSSDAVTALAYDDTTELLHVGTSDGRSDFQGLRRINNTTDPVTTAISAHDSLIIEQ